MKNKSKLKTKYRGLIRRSRKGRVVGRSIHGSAVFNRSGLASKVEVEVKITETIGKSFDFFKDFCLRKFDCLFKPTYVMIVNTQREFKQIIERFQLTFFT